MYPFRVALISIGYFLRDFTLKASHGSPALQTQGPPMPCKRGLAEAYTSSAKSRLAGPDETGLKTACHSYPPVIG